MGKVKAWREEQIWDCVEAFRRKDISEATAKARLRELSVDEDETDLYLFGDLE